MKIIKLACILLFFALTSASCANGQNIETTEYLYEDFDKDTLLILDTQDVRSVEMRGYRKVIYDKKDCDIASLFSKANCTYVIRHPHIFNKISVPKGCEVYFDGGELVGNIVFNHTYLSGIVRLKGSTIEGTISNGKFYTGWICNGDGVSDDADNINRILNVCDTVVVQRGMYKLINSHVVNPSLSEQYHESVKSHIGIYRSNKTIIGEKGATFISTDNTPIMCIYSQPYEIDRGTKNISISNIIFQVYNNSKSFYEFCHTIKLIGVSKTNIVNCKFNDFLGDAICLSHYGDTPSTGERTRNIGVVISNNYIYGGSHNNRNAISVISGENVCIKDNFIVEVSKEGMPGAIDIEPNNSAYTIFNITIEGNTIIKSLGGAGAINITCLDKSAPAHYIKINNNRMYDCRHGIVVWIKSDNTTNDITITNNYTNKNTPSYYFGGEGTTENMIIRGNKFLGKTSAKIGGNIKIKNFINDLTN